MNWRGEISIEQLSWRLFVLAYMPTLLIGDWLIRLWTPQASSFAFPAEAHIYLLSVVQGRLMELGLVMLIATALATTVTRYNLRKYDIYNDSQGDNESSKWLIHLGTLLLLLWFGLLVWSIIQPIVLGYQMLGNTFYSVEEVAHADFQFKQSTLQLLQIVCLAFVGWPLYRQSHITRTHFLSKGVQDVR